MLLCPFRWMHCGKKCLEWVRKFFSFCLERTVIPKIWRRATVVAILKPNKPADDPKSYRPISLLCVFYKILERLILARINPVIEPQLPTQQAGFRQGRSTVQQILKLTCEIEKSFENGYKAGAVMVDLTAAYDTVWHQGLALKLLRTIPDHHLVRFIMTILSNSKPALDKSVDCAYSRMVYRKAQHCRQSCLTSTSATSQQLSPTNTVTQMTWHFFTPTSAGQKLKKRYLEIWKTLLTS